MRRFVLFSLGIALILLCQALMKSEGADKFPPDGDRDDQEDGFFKCMLIYGPIVITFFSLLIAILAYSHELNMIMNLAPVLFLLIMISVIQYCIQFVFTDRARSLRTACSYFLAGVMTLVAVVTPFYASWLANTGCCARRVSQGRKHQRDYGVHTLPEIALGDLTIQQSVASPVPRVRLTQTYSASKPSTSKPSPSKSSSSFNPSSPEREVQVLIHTGPKSPARQSDKSSSPAIRVLSSTASPSSGSIIETYSPKSDSYAPLCTGSTESSHHSELLLEYVPGSSDDCSQTDPGTLIPLHTTVITENTLGSDEDEHAV